MHYGAMTLQDYDQVMALCAGQPGVSIRDGEALAGYILCGHDGRRGAIHRAEYFQKQRPAGEGRMGCASNA